MKKTDLWIIASFILAMLIDPENGDLGWSAILYANFILAIVTKAAMVAKENESKSNEADNKR